MTGYDSMLGSGCHGNNTVLKHYLGRVLCHNIDIFFYKSLPGMLQKNSPLPKSKSGHVIVMTYHASVTMATVVSHLIWTIFMFSCVF